MRTVHTLSLNFGQYPAPQSLVDAMRSIPMKADKVLGPVPNAKTEAGAKYYAWLKAQEGLEAKAYIANEPFTPGEYV